MRHNRRRWHRQRKAARRRLQLAQTFVRRCVDAVMTPSEIDKALDLAVVHGLKGAVLTRALCRQRELSKAAQ